MATKEMIDKFRWVQEEHLNRGNLDAMDQFSDPDFVLHMYPFPACKGLPAVKRRIAALGKHFSNPRIEFDEIISEGDTIAARYTVRMQHTGEGELFPAPPTGKEVVMKGCLFSHLKDGMEVEAFEFDDFLGLAQQLGIAPSLGKK
jgi:predicted ester cyclase